MTFSIRSKFMLIITLPMLGLIASATFLLYHFIDRLELKAANIAVREYQMGMLDLIYRLQTERGSHALAHTLENDHTLALFEQASAQTDHALKQIERLSANHHEVVRVNTLHDRLDESVKKIRSFRELINHNTRNERAVKALFSAYTEHISQLTDMLYLHPFDTFDATQQQTFHALNQMYDVQILRGEMRAFIARLLANSTYDAQLMKDALEHRIAVDQLFGQSLRQYASVYDGHFDQEFEQVSMRIEDIVDMLDEFYATNWGNELALHYHVMKEDIGLRPDVWFTLASKQMEHTLSWMQDLLSDEVVTQQQAYDELKYQLQWWIAIYLVTLLLTLSSVYVVSRGMVRNIRQLSDGIHRFFEYLTFKRQTIDAITVSSGDELSEMAQTINLASARIVEQSANDNEFLEEVNQIIASMRSGHFDERIYFDANHPALQKLKGGLNSMLDVIEEKIRATTYELQLNNARLEEEIESRVNELHQIDMGISRSMLLFSLDKENRLISLNDAMCERIECSKEKMVNQRIFEYFSHSTDGRALMEEVDAELVHEGISHKQLEFLSASGVPVYMDATFIHLKNRSGEVLKKLALCNDITQIVMARIKAEEAEKAKGDFLANMSHEIRTPLNAILGFVEILQKTIDNAKHRKYIDIIHNSGKSLLGVINDILDFSKIQSGSFTISPVHFSPLDEMSHVVQLHASKMEDKQILFLAHIDIDLPALLEGDILRIKQVISNLLSNAAKFTPENGEVKVSVDYKSGNLVFRIQDNGIGMDEEQRSRIFNAFEQADSSTTRKFGGTGLGLSISASLVEMMDGTISVESEPGVGTTFSVSLPLKLVDGDYSLNIDQEKIGHTTVAIMPFKKQYRDVERLLRHYLSKMGVQHIYDMSEIPADLTYEVLLGPLDQIDIKEIELKQQYTIGIALTGKETAEPSPLLHLLHSPFVPRALLDVLDEATEATLRLMGESSEADHCSFKGHLLVAEDNKTNQMLISLLLDDYGIDYEIVENGKEALEAFKASAYDLVFMDVNMPVMGGVESTKAIRAYESDSSRKQTPIIALTANVMSEDREIYEASGMNDHLAKPIETDQLEKVLTRYLAEK
jgi:signal transduction histidine kinase/ActR/RegA family two-component response regulator